MSLLVPVIAKYHLLSAQLLLVFFIVFYAFSEWKKVRRKYFFAHKLILRMQRDDEKTEFAKAPLLLATGILMAITFFTWEASLVGIYQAGFCDTVAALCGKKWGKTKIPFLSRKTYVGSLAFFIAAVPFTLLFLPPSKAIVVCLFGAFLESLPFKDWDNLSVPFFISLLADQFLIISY